MSDRITRKDCEAQLRILAAHTVRPLAERWPYPAGGLRLNDESGVKRLREIPADGHGESDVGPGFLTWRELWGFLKGANEGISLLSGSYERLDPGSPISWLRETDDGLEIRDRL